MANDTNEKAKRDFRQDLTNQIVDLIEQGAAPWQKPWNPDEASAFLEMPRNATSGRAYRGGNAIQLMMKAQAFGSSDPRWCTFKQAQAEGWQVRKGSKGTSVEYWQFDKEEERINPANGKKEKVTVKLENPRVFYATVFHASQIEGIPEYKPRERPEGWNPVHEAERILSGSGARIYHDQQDRAYYSPSADDIHLPPREAFPQPLDYYEVAMHELGHWTGHPSRLNRDLSGGFGSESYAREELRAQMASLYLSAELGVPFNPDRHAAYQASWVKALKEDKHEIFRAARDAEIMADYVLDLARERTIEQGQELAADPAIARALEADIAEAMNDPSVSFDHFTAFQGTSLDDALRSRNLATVGAVTGHDPEQFYQTAHDRLSAVFGIDPEHDEMGNAYLERKGLAQHFALTAERLTKALELARDQQPEQAVALPTPDQEPKSMETEQEVAATGITRIDDKEANSIRYTHSTLENGDKAYAVAFYSGSKVVAKFDGLDADALADTVGDKNAQAIIAAESEKGILKGTALANEYGLSPEESARRVAEKDARKAVEYDAMKLDAEKTILADLQSDPKMYRDRLSRATVDELEYHRDHLDAMLPLNTQNPFWQRHELPFEVDSLEQNIDKSLDKIDVLLDMHHTRTPVAELSTMPGVTLAVNDRKELIASLPAGNEVMFGGTPAFITWAAENGLTVDERNAAYKALGGIAQENKENDRRLAAHIAKSADMLGEDAKLYSPRPDAARQYDGKFIYMNENYAVQQIGKDSAIVHEIDKIGRNAEAIEKIAHSIDAGQALRMTYEPGREIPAIADAPTQEQNRERMSRSFQEVKKAVTAELGGEAKTFIPNRNAQEYRGTVIYVNDTHVVQQVGKATAIAHLRENFDEVPDIGGQMRVSYKDGKMTQRTTPGQEAELQALKSEHLGKDAKLQFAYDNEGRQEFDGPIVAETGSYVIQKINDQTAVVHAKTNLQKDVEVGDNVAIVYERGKVYAEELGTDKERERAEHAAQERGKTPESAREQVRERFGKDAKVIDAKFVDAEQGTFTGTVVAKDDDRVIQRIGANKFISHDVSALDGGDAGIGQFVKVQYSQGKAIVQNAQRQQQQERSRGPDRELTH